MKGFCGGLFGCMSSTLMALIKCLFVVVLGIVVLIQALAIVGLFWLDNNSMDKALPDLEIGLGDYLVTLGTLSLAMVGLYGSCTNNPKYLKFFAIVASLCAVGSLVFYSDSAKQVWRHHKNQFSERMEEMAKDYQWDKDSGKESNDATKVWNVIQRGLMCCGLSGPQDWSQKWKSSQRGVLPDSCCLILSRSLDRNSMVHKKMCKLDNAFQEGCLDSMQNFVDNQYMYTVIGSAMWLVLSIMALMIARRAEFELAASSNAPTTHYQRFEGSVYVRQPSVVPPSTVKQPAFAPSHDGASLYASMTNDKGAPPKYDNLH